MGYFDAIYHDDELTHRAKAVYMYLKDRTGRSVDCWPAVSTIAGDLRLGRSTVKRALDDLVRAGLLKKEPRYRENGSSTSNRLILTRSQT